MEIDKDVIFARFDAGERVGSIADDAGTQFLGMARVIAAEHMGTKPGELHAETMLDGNVRVEMEPSRSRREARTLAAKIIAGWPVWKQRICMLQARLRRREV